MTLYQHDGPELFQFVLSGRLEGPGVCELRDAWATAASVMNGKAVVVDVASLTGADEAAIDLLSRMRESGARIVPPVSPSVSESFRDSGSLATPAHAPERRGGLREFAARSLGRGAEH